MSDIRAPDAKELAEKDYILGMKYKDIAAKYNVSLNTVKSWKQRCKWSREGVHTKERVCTQKKNIEKSVQEPIQQEVEEVLNNSSLTDKQKLFCVYYLKYFNATKAARKAGYQGEYVDRMGYQLLENTRVKEEIQRLKRNKLNRVMLSEEDIFQKYIDIAFSDITDYVEFGQEEVPVMGPFGPIKDEDGNEVKQVINVVKFKKAEEVDGTIISEVSQGKNGAKLKLQDKMKALQWLSDRMDLLPKETQIKLENEEKKLNHMLNKNNKDNSKKDDILTKMLEGLKHGI